MTLGELQTQIDRWIAHYGVRYFSPLTNMACLAEEVGELARIMARAYGDQSFKAGEPTDIRAALAEEMADILWVVGCLANQTGVDLEDALRASFEKKTRRDATRHRTNPKLAAGTGNETSGHCAATEARMAGNAPEENHDTPKQNI